jgi:hypothetical protein
MHRVRFIVSPSPKRTSGFRPAPVALADAAERAGWVESGPSASGREARRAAVTQSYFSGRNNFAIASCSGTSGKNASR